MTLMYELDLDILPLDLQDQEQSIFHFVIKSVIEKKNCKNGIV